LKAQAFFLFFYEEEKRFLNFFTIFAGDFVRN